MSAVHMGFTFPAGTTLAPLGRIVVVENEVAFEANYGSMIDLAGQYTGKLNNGGERIEILDWQGQVIQSFNYNDNGKWPKSADGRGASLTLMTPLENPSHDEPEHWRASSVVGGTPGIPDDVGFRGDPTADHDGDGIVAFLKHVFGFSDSVPNSDSMIRFTTDGEFPVFSFQRDTDVTDVTIWVEWSEDLDQWESGEDYVQLVSEENTEEGAITVVYRTTKSLKSTPTQHLRLLAK
jgi:hypothetical protein